MVSEMFQGIPWGLKMVHAFERVLENFSGYLKISGMLQGAQGWHSIGYNEGVCPDFG